MKSRFLVLSGIFLALVVIVLGAHARLTDAGLGCPDWPGCYGKLFVSQVAAEIDSANAAFPERPVELDKAWNEMVHRYFASFLGLLILALAVRAVIKRGSEEPLKLPLFLLALVIFQGALGMWTVTLNLLPVVVMGHLLGGFAVLVSLVLLYLRLSPINMIEGHEHLQRYTKFAFIGIAIVIVQIALGGWVSANYAALVCTEFPICEAGWQNRLDFPGAFSVPEAENYEFGKHDYGERVTMHIVHRIGAILTFIYVGWFAAMLFLKSHAASIKICAVILALVLLIQVALGISNVVFSLPLSIAVLHNAFAAFLLVSIVSITYLLVCRVRSHSPAFSGVPNYG